MLEGGIGGGELEGIRRKCWKEVKLKVGRRWEEIVGGIEERYDEENVEGWS